MKAIITYCGKLGGLGSTKEIEVVSERAALALASKGWTHGCGDIIVHVNGHRRERRFWSQSGQWGLLGWDK